MSPVLAFFKAGPPWLAVDGQHVRVDLAGLLRDQGAGEMLPFLKSLHVGTREGALLVRFGLQVPPPRVD